MADQDLDKTLDASAYKLSRARSQGKAPRSAEFVSAAVLLCGALALYAKSDDLLRRAFAFDARLLRDAGSYGAAGGSFDTIWTMLARMATDATTWLAPFFGALVLVAVIASVVQIGVMTSFDPLKPDWSRINPVAGFKRLVSLQSLYHALRTIAKLVVLIGVGYSAVVAEIPSFMQLAALSASDYLQLLMHSIGAVAIKVGATLLLLALIDLWYVRFDFARRMRMSRREMREEHKHREGDPRIRARLRELRMEAYKRSTSSRGLPKADVLIVNPTRVAIALHYEHGAMSSPRVVAKGVGAVARKMREYASQRGIPIVENRKLARALLRRVDIDSAIPEDLFTDVARIIVWVLAMRRRNTRGTAPKKGAARPNPQESAS
ncbi:EscU/YscU/HrcU family type III secretion system export apparatus switch protein [Paraburkholderia ferrariae]|uniref:EscU/YscU/HrcU family type III secretion system export apparatus switch protein n=1 Tax=Paraburkholderia ferrariae TaxID=386056 RepID=A0ABU9RMG1_9BURK